jgi:ubiquinol-cytochrome c reductase cytochrome c subunit
MKQSLIPNCPQRSRNHGLVFMAAFSLFVASGSVAAEEQGRQLYESKGCYQCHGYVGQGGSAGPALAPRVLPAQVFAQIVRKPPNVMPAYSPKVLTDAELRAIYLYIASLKE